MNFVHVYLIFVKILNISCLETIMVDHPLELPKEMSSQTSKLSLSMCDQIQYVNENKQSKKKKEKRNWTPAHKNPHGSQNSVHKETEKNKLRKKSIIISQTSCSRLCSCGVSSLCAMLHGNICNTHATQQHDTMCWTLYVCVCVCYRVVLGTDFRL